MNARPVAQVLIHFGLPQTPHHRRDHQNESPAADPVDNASEVTPAGDLEAIVRAAREEGFAHGMSEARKQWDEKLQQETLAFERKLAAERANWTREESQMLCTKIEAAIAAVELRLAGCIARILKPIIAEAVRAKILDALADNVRVLLRGQKCPVLSVSGPEDLLAALREKLSHLPATFEYALNEAADVQIAAGETFIESQLAAFAACVGAEGA